jgi:DNA-binding SARP family transcriptional activator/DNA-binding CsgD family transcriptional regulator
MTNPETPICERLEAMRVWLLSGFRVSVGTRTIEAGEWRLRKAASLVKLLALAPGHRLHKEQAMDLLWPHPERRAASNNLRQVVHVARHTLAPTDGSLYLASDSELLVLCPRGDLWVDADAFEVAATTARRAREAAAYRAAIDLYAGDLLPEDRYEAWAEDRREGLRQTYLALLVGLAKLGRGEHELAAASFKEALTVSQKAGRKPSVINALEGMASLAGGLEESTRAALLRGAADAARQETGIPLPTIDRALHRPYLQAARSSLGQAAWKEALTEGRAMSLSVAVEYALAEEDHAPPTVPMPDRSPAFGLMGNLTRREQEVAHLVIRGLTNRQIAAELSISERTAGNHVAKVLRKLGLRSRAQIAVRAGNVADAAETGTASGVVESDG